MFFKTKIWTNHFRIKKKEAINDHFIKIVLFIYFLFISLICKRKYFTKNKFWEVKKKEVFTFLFWVEKRHCYLFQKKKRYYNSFILMKRRYCWIPFFKKRKKIFNPFIFRGRSYIISTIDCKQGQKSSRSEDLKH